MARKSPKRADAPANPDDKVGKLAVVGVREVWRDGGSEEIVYIEWIGPVAEIDAQGQAVIADPYLGKREYPAALLFPTDGLKGVRAGAALIGFVEFQRTGTQEKYEEKADYHDTPQRVLKALQNPS